LRAATSIEESPALSAARNRESNSDRNSGAVAISVRPMLSTREETPTAPDVARERVSGFVQLAVKSAPQKIGPVPP
jgi:hypothetical protein